MSKNTIYETYKKIKYDEPVNTGGFSKTFIVNCFKYKILKKKPSKEYKKWFESTFDCKYPVYLSDISKSLKKDLDDTIKYKKKQEKQEEQWRQQRYQRGYSDLDYRSIFSWFLDLMPKMLQQMRDNLEGYPVDIDTVNLEKNTDEFEEWKNTLDRMIFLLKEMNEDTCSYKNSHEKEYYDLLDDFRKKYGDFGEELKTKEEREREKEKGEYRQYNPQDFPELYPNANDLSYKFTIEELKKGVYMDRCREEFFNLFSKYFYSLWI